MCNVNYRSYSKSSTGSDSTINGFSASNSYGTGWSESSSTPDLTAHDFITAPAFQIFREQLRRAVRCLTMAEFLAFRRRYEDVWQEVLEEL